MKYDAAIIGAGADGLAAATLLARAGLKTVLLERGSIPGGRCVTRAFHPGFFASSFCDGVPAIPPVIAGLIGIGAPRAPLHPSFLEAAVARRRDGLLARILREAATPHPSAWLAQLKARLSPPDDSRADWPGTDWADRGEDEVAGAFARHALDPRLKGSALALLAGRDMAPRRGGLGTLGQLLTQKAWASGAELRLGHEAAEIRLARGRVRAVVLHDGSLVETDAVISTLDYKRSLMALFRWNALPSALLGDAAAWRVGPPSARLLLALTTPPLLETPRLLPGGPDAMAAFRRGAIPARPAMILNPVSRRDPALAPPGAGVLTVTLRAIPFALFDGPWTQAKRQLLAARALSAIEAALPGTQTALAAIEVLTPPDIEEQLGVTGGDLSGGALAPDQMLGWRPGPRLGIRGAYLAGPSSAAGPLGACAGGVAAAVALLADRRA